MEGSVPQSGGKGSKGPRQNSLKKQNSTGSNYSRNSGPPYQHRRGMAGNYDSKSSYRNDDRGSIVPEGMWANHALISLLCNLIGYEVRFRLKNGNEYEGIFEAFSPKGDFAFALCCQLKNGCVPDTSKVLPQSIVKFAELASISAKEVNIINLKADFETDSGISQRLMHGPDPSSRQLEAWEPDDDENMLTLEDDPNEATSNNGGWSADDMFRKNKPLQDKEAKAGILKNIRHADYDGKTVDPFSNVTADESEVTDEIREIAASIERTAASTADRVRMEKEDTEENFSAVLGSRSAWSSSIGGSGGSGGRGNRSSGLNRTRGGASGAGRGQAYLQRKADNRLSGLPPQVNHSPYQSQQSPPVPTSYAARMQQGPGGSTTSPNALTQNRVPAKPSPPPQMAPSPAQAGQYTSPVAGSFTSSQPGSNEEQPVSSNGGTYANAAAADYAGGMPSSQQQQPPRGSSHYIKEAKGSWRPSGVSAQAVEQQKRDLTQHHQSQINTMDRADLVQDLKQTTPSIAVPQTTADSPMDTSGGSAGAPVTASSSPMAATQGRTTVTVKAGGQSSVGASPHASVGGQTTVQSPSVGAEMPASASSMDSQPAESHTDSESAARTKTPISGSANSAASTPHPPVAATSSNEEQHPTTPSSTSATPSSSASAMSNFLKKLNPLAQEFVPRGPASVTSPAPSTSASTVQSPIATSVTGNIVSPSVMNPPVLGSSATGSASAAPPPQPPAPTSASTSVAGNNPMIPAQPPAVVSVINQPTAAATVPPTVPPSVVPNPPRHPLPSSSHHPQHHSGGGHHRGGRNSQQYSNHSSNQQRSSDFSSAGPSTAQDSPVASGSAFAISQPVVSTPQAWLMAQQPQVAGTQIAYYPVASHANPSAAAASAARFATVSSGGQNPHHAVVSTHLTRPPTVAQQTSTAPIMYTTAGGQQAQVVGKPGGAEYSQTFSIVPTAGGQSYAVLQPAAQAAVSGQPSTAHAGAQQVAFYQQAQNQAGVTTLQQAQAAAAAAAAASIPQHTSQTSAAQATAQVAQQMHQQQQLHAQHQQQQQQQQQSQQQQQQQQSLHQSSQQQQQQQQQHLVQQLQQANLNGQQTVAPVLVQQALAAQAQQQYVAVAQAQQQHQNQQQQAAHMLSTPQTPQQTAVQNAALAAAAAVPQSQHGQNQNITAAATPQVFCYYPAVSTAMGQAPSGTTAPHPALLQSGVQPTQAQVVPTQFYAAHDPRYPPVPVGAQQNVQPGTNHVHSNVATPAQTPTGSGPPFLFMTTGAPGMQNLAYHYQPIQLVTPTGQPVQPGQPTSQSSGQ